LLFIFRYFERHIPDTQEELKSREADKELGAGRAERRDTVLISLSEKSQWKMQNFLKWVYVICVQVGNSSHCCTMCFFS